MTLDRDPGDCERHKPRFKYQPNILTTQISPGLVVQNQVHGGHCYQLRIQHDVVRHHGLNFLSTKKFKEEIKIHNTGQARIFFFPCIGAHNTAIYQFLKAHSASMYCIMYPHVLVCFCVKYDSFAKPIQSIHMFQIIIIIIILALTH